MKVFVSAAFNPHLSAMVHVLTAIAQKKQVKTPPVISIYCAGLHSFDFCSSTAGCMSAGHIPRLGL